MQQMQFEEVACSMGGGSLQILRRRPVWENWPTSMTKSDPASTVSGWKLLSCVSADSNCGLVSAVWVWERDEGCKTTILVLASSVVMGLLLLGFGRGRRPSKGLSGFVGVLNAQKAIGSFFGVDWTAWGTGLVDLGCTVSWTTFPASLIILIVSIKLQWFNSIPLMDVSWFPWHSFAWSAGPPVEHERSQHNLGSYQGRQTWSETNSSHLLKKTQTIHLAWWLISQLWGYPSWR